MNTKFHVQVFIKAYPSLCKGKKGVAVCLMMTRYFCLSTKGNVFIHACNVCTLFCGLCYVANKGTKSAQWMICILMLKSFANETTFSFRLNLTLWEFEIGEINSFTASAFGNDTEKSVANKKMTQNSPGSKRWKSGCKSRNTSCGRRHWQSACRRLTNRGHPQTWSLRAEKGRHQN